MRRRRDIRRSKAGVTLVEVMLAGAMTSFVVLFMLAGFTLSASIARTNCQTLCDDNVAFDLMWYEFNRDYKQLEAMKDKGWFPNPAQETWKKEGRENWEEGSPYLKTGSDPLASSEEDYPQYKFQFKVEAANEGIILKLKLFDKTYNGSEEEKHLLKSFSMFRSEIPR